METPITTNPIIDDLKRYLETKFKLAKLQGIDKASSLIAEVLTDLIMGLTITLTFILFSITLALYIGQLLNSEWEGFGCVTIFYLLLVLMVRLAKGRLQNLFIRLFIQKIFTKN